MEGFGLEAWWLTNASSQDSTPYCAAALRSEFPKSNPAPASHAIHLGRAGPARQVNGQDFAGLTPLHLAARLGHGPQPVHSGRLSQEISSATSRRLRHVQV